MFCAAAKIVVVDSGESSTSVLVIDISSLFVMEMFSNENETLTLKRKTDGWNCFCCGNTASVVRHFGFL